MPVDVAAFKLSSLISGTIPDSVVSLSMNGEKTMTNRKTIHQILTELRCQEEDIRLRKEADREIDRQAESSGSAPDLQNDGS